MQQEVEDIKKLEAVLQEERSHNNLQEDFEDLLNYNISDDDEQLDGYKSDSSVELEGLTEDKLQIAQTKHLDINSLNFSKNLGSVKHHLLPEEIRVINSCTDSKLKHLLLLNRAKSNHLQSVLYQLYLNLKEVREQALRLNEESKVRTEKGCNIKRNMLYNVGYPYFKAKLFPCALNEDAIRKMASGETCLDYLNRRRRWTLEDQIILKRSVSYQYTKSRITETENKIVDLKRLIKSTGDEDKRSDCMNEINECEKLLVKFKDVNSTHEPSLNEDGMVDWNLIAENELSGRHTVSACKAMWNMYLHPSINKSKWTEGENTKLKDLAEQNNYQDWEKIAKELGTNRTAFTVCVHFRSTLIDLCNRGKFEQEEDEQLLKAIDTYRIGNYIPWSKIAQLFPNRARTQLYSRYMGNLKVTYQKKGTFSEEEDVLIILLVRKFGLDFTTICNYIPYRNRMQISHRYNNYLNYDELQNGGWSLSDDSKIMSHVKEHGARSWQKLVDQIPKRNACHFRHRYFFLEKWLDGNKGKTIEDISRKSEKKPKHNIAVIKKIADMFDGATEIPSLEDIKQKIKSTVKKRGRRPAGYYINHAVDDELLQYFQSTHKLRTARQITSSEMSAICSSIKSILAIMNVVLIVPQKNCLSQIPTLDYLDKEILSFLFENVYSQHPHLTSKNIEPNNKEIRIEFKFDDEISLLPPNLNTLIGMRGMLLKHSGFKSKLTKAVNASNFTEAKSTINSNLQLKLGNYDGETQKAIGLEHANFASRLKALFKWPAVMSLVEPCENLTVFSTKKVTKPPAPARKVGRPRKDTSKIDLMNQRRLMKRNQLAMTNNQQSENTSNKSIENQMETIIEELVDDASSSPRKKRKLNNCLNEELHEDIKKLDSILLNELKNNEDVC